MKNTKIIIRTKSKSYNIYVGNGLLKSTFSLIKKNIPNVKKIAIISDRNVPPSYLKILSRSLKKYEIKIYRIHVNEKVKSFKTANQLVENLLKNNFNRSDCVIALGGGIVSDLSAFVANLTKRGIKLINIPTTLLAQVDASIGGKTGINSVEGKNLIGTFYQPDFVLIDLSFLKTLSQRHMICGYAEILKHALISNKKFFLWLSKNAKKMIFHNDMKNLKLAILKSCEIKSKVVSMDEKEKNLRMILNFGHTFAHGFEGALKFSKKLYHGEAVLLGIFLACEFSYMKKILPGKDLDMIKKHYTDLNLIKDIRKKFKKKEINKIIYFMKNDKKILGKK